ncbi:amidohydrolase/deacetylase family metallohydrolase [Edaphobacter sp. 12200R-103]|jgi:dihydroorotase|uniref:amidohydrolase/deacetylase family metallohydrolase n=1 Tax=Edaphobacter sp. 12200R-103 TaxID=2703788 RepID=UPI00138D6CEE|nr:amidohydrolase/deacetylase family metallohydrolase [Edaphobacter sp. 12200R-103]QHS52910.1 amidohydrolase/deacetylase family metallohydrolase [Edaphobacter sp. 12200R-103]
MLRILVAALFACSLSVYAQQYDLVLRNGHVIDPKNSVDAVRDVAVRDGKIAAIEPSIPASAAKKAVDISGLYLTPGLVDIHEHVFIGLHHNAWGNGDLSVQADVMAIPNGVTTIADAGSSGWRDFAEFRHRIIDNSKTRIFAFLNIIGSGMVNADDVAEQNEHDMDVDALTKVIEQNRDIIIGIKTAHWEQPNFISVNKAIVAGNRNHLPVMVDFGWFNNKSYEEMISTLLRPGDISTHVFRMPAPLLTPDGKPAPYMLQARRRGVKFDVGHGGGSFNFALAEPMIKNGFFPDSISTDLHVGSATGVMLNMPNVMSKILALGVPLAEVIRESTTNPATEIGHPELGQIAVGSVADIAVLRVDHGHFGYADLAGGKVDGTERIVPEMTIRAGHVVFDLNARTAVPWREGHLKYATH